MVRRSAPLLLALSACNGGPDPVDTPLLDLPETGRFRVEGLGGPAYVVYDAYGTPTIYANDAYDAAAVHGFVAASQRYVQMDLTRRLGRANLSELVGDVALEADIDAAQTGTRHITERVLATLTDAQALEFLAYARGVNTYLALAAAGDLPAPSEYEILAPLLGHEEIGAVLSPWGIEDVAAVVAAFTLNAGFSDRELGWTRDLVSIEGRYEGQALGDLREAGVIEDVWGRVAHVHGVDSAPGWDTGARRGAGGPAPRPVLPAIPSDLLDRAADRHARWERRLRRDPEDGWGSNAWALMGRHSEGGAALLAGDGHLDLSAPSFVWAVGIDTAHLAPDGEGFRLYGVTSPGMPTVAAGTNGYVAWSSTQPFADINDHYREVVQLGEGGEPVATRFDGAWEPVQRFEDAFLVADVPFLDSVGRTETIARWTTFDGRWIFDIEGRGVGADYVPAAGEAVLNLGGRRVVPEDTDGDGEIVALSFDFTGLDERGLLGFFGVREARTVREFQEVLAHTAALSQNFVVADHEGSVLYTQFQAMPCRTYLDRGPDGRFADGANPRFILDGTRYPGFEIPFTEAGRLAFGEADPRRCVIPVEDYPHAIDPEQGYALSANNDPGGLTADDDLENDAIYIGGPWEDDYRAARIDEVLAGHAAADSGSVAAMAALQADHRSNLGVQLAPVLLDTIDRARGLVGAAERTPAEERVAALFTANEDRFEEVEARLSAWRDGGYDTPSGVDTDYDPLQPGDEADAVATMIFNTWLPRLVDLAIGDEGIPGGLLSTITGATGRTRTLTWMLDGRGEGNPLGLASFNPDTNESAFWDRLGTEPVETSDEIALLALEQALDTLSGPVGADFTGGFGTEEMDAWLWGYRHWVSFPSLLLTAFGDEGQVGALAAQFTIDPRIVPVKAGVSPADPRARMPGWPRHGDALNVDAGNPGWSGTRWNNDFGPAFRMVIALHGDGAFSGQNALPGGASAIAGSAHWADQVPLWLGNEAAPIVGSAEDAVAIGVERHTIVGGGRSYWE